MKSIKVKFKKLHPNATIPQPATTGAGAMDVTATEIIHEDGYVRCLVGFSTEIPEGYRIICAARSSVSTTGWVLANSMGIVDSDYRGQWEFRFVPIPEGSVYFATQLKYKEFPYKVGDRVGQIFIEKVTDFEFVESEELSETARSGGGFGSTGNSGLPSSPKISTILGKHEILQDTTLGSTLMGLLSKKGFAGPPYSLKGIAISLNLSEDSASFFLYDMDETIYASSNPETFKQIVQELIDYKVK